jgi:hypothetical protein
LTADTWHGPRPSVTFLGLSLGGLQTAAVWLMLAASFYVIREPAPCDLIFLVAAGLLAFGGLDVRPAIAPLFLFLLTYNLGGYLSYIGIAGDDKARMFVITSAYMSVTAVVFASYVSRDPVARMKIFANGYVAGATVAAAIGIASYFNIAGLGVLAPIERAQGTFKDPNVLSTYLVLPAIFLTQGFMLGGRGYRLLRLIALMLVLGCLFLAFSRGAWINFTSAAVLMILLTFALTPSPPLRSRIVILSLLGALLVVALLALLLSIDSVRSLFLDRLTLLKSYDTGEHGRFGNQLNAIPMLLERPLGFGPLQFGQIFGLDPHNTFVNAFASYGWLGGLSYLLLVLSTIAVGFRAVLVRTPWQNYAIAVFCPLLTTILQGVQIDTDHWRHFYWMLGLMWGLYAASLAYRPAAGEAAS